jgi:hypothetical protein
MENKAVEAPVKEAKKDAAPKVDQAPVVDAAQTIEQGNYVPKYVVKPEFQQAVLKAVGDAPFNQIAGIMQAINVTEVDHNQLQQILGALGNFPYIKIAPILQNVSNYVEQKLDD